MRALLINFLTLNLAACQNLLLTMPGSKHDCFFHFYGKVVQTYLKQTF